MKILILVLCLCSSAYAKNTSQMVDPDLLPIPFAEIKPGMSLQDLILDCFQRNLGSMSACQGKYIHNIKFKPEVPKKNVPEQTAIILPSDGGDVAR